MKKLTAVLLTLLCVSGYAFSSLPVEENFGSPSDHGFEIGLLKDINDFMIDLKSKKDEKTETNIIRYIVTEEGVTCHVGVYADGVIVTALDGTEQGKQVIIVNDSITGISYDLEQKKDHFIHKYTWGKVYSYDNKQIMHVKK